MLTRIYMIEGNVIRNLYIVMILYRNVECIFEKHKIAARYPKKITLKYLEIPYARNLLNSVNLRVVAHSFNSYIPN